MLKPMSDRRRAITRDLPERDLPKRRLQEGDLFGRLEIPRLNLSVMVMEGVSSRTLRLGAGHIREHQWASLHTATASFVR